MARKAEELSEGAVRGGPGSVSVADARAALTAAQALLAEWAQRVAEAQASSPTLFHGLLAGFLDTQATRVEYALWGLDPANLEEAKRRLVARDARRARMSSW